MAVMLVHACGASYTDGQLFCPRCRQPVDAAPIRLADPATGPASGGPSLIMCPHCQRETPAGALCVRCLEPLGEQQLEPVETPFQRVNLPHPLDERYEFVRELPSGGQADVLVCADRDHAGRLVVVKLYRPGITIEDAAIAELREVATERAHVVPILDFGRSRGLPWEVQEYLPAGSLADLLARGPVDERVVVDLVRQIWAALTWLHDAQLIHRDLKPSNVLLRDLQPVDVALADFGLVARLDATVDVRTVAGTYAALPPESRGNIVSKAMDWWALGVIVVEALTGRHLFADPAGARLLPESIIRNQLYEGTFAVPSVSPRWDPLLRGLLTADYQARWGSDEVDDWLHHRMPRPRAELAAPSSHAGSAEPSPFPGFELAGQRYDDPRELAAALRAQGAAATRAIGTRHDELAAWLSRHAPAALAALTGESPEADVVRLQLALDPAESPALRGRLLSNAGLTSVIRAASGGDISCGRWIADLRAARVLSAWASGAIVPQSVAAADDVLDGWWGHVDAVLTGLPQEVVRTSRPALEGLLLEVALDPARQADLVERGRLAARGHHPAWAAELAARAGDGPAQAALAQVVLPRGTAFATLRSRALEVESIAVARTIREDDRERFAGAVRASLGPAVVATVLLAWGLHGLSGLAWPAAGIGAAVAGALTVVAMASWFLVLPATLARAGWALGILGPLWALERVLTRGPSVPTAAWLWLPASLVVSAWAARTLNLVLDDALGLREIPDPIPWQGLRRPALVAAAAAVLAASVHVYGRLAAARLVPSPAVMRTRDPDRAVALAHWWVAHQPVHLSPHAAHQLVTIGFVAAIVLLVGSPDVARLHGRAIATLRTGVLALGVVGLAVTLAPFVVIACGSLATASGAVGLVVAARVLAGRCYA